MNLTRNILTTLTARILVLGLALVSSMTLARALGPEGRGLFALIVLLPELVRIVALLGFEQANPVYAGLEPSGRRALVWQSAVTALVVGGLVGLGGVAYVAFGMPGLEHMLRGPAWLYVIPFTLLPARLLAEYWMSILRGMNRIVLLNVFEVATKAASLALILAFVVWLGAGVAGALATDAVLLAATLLVLVLLLSSFGVLGRPTFDGALWRRTALFALPTHCAGVMNYLNYRIDQFIVALLLPVEQLAFYVLAVEIAERLWIIPGAIATPLLPHLANSPERDPALAAAVARHALLWTGAGCVVLSLIAGVAVELLYTSKFAETAVALRWLLPGIFTLTCSKVLVAELMAREKIRFTLWLMPLAAGVNVALNLLLVPRMGIAGAGLASSLSYTLVAVVMTGYYLWETGVPWTALVPGTADLKVYGKLFKRLGGSPKKEAPVPQAESGLDRDADGGVSASCPARSG